MAGVGFNVTSASVATGTSAKTILQIVAPTNQRLLVRRATISFKGTVNSNAPVKVDILRQTTAGTSSAATVVKKNDADDETLQTTARETFTVEPTAGDVLTTSFIHPQGGALDIMFPDKLPIPVKGGGRLGLRVTADNDVQCVASFEGEE